MNLGATVHYCTLSPTTTTIVVVHFWWWVLRGRAIKNFYPCELTELFPEVIIGKLS